MNLRKAIKVIFVDLFGLLIGIINGFLLPKYLSIDSYADIKMFALYISYSGIFHLGFSDGIYIALGGANIDSVKKETIKGYLKCLLKILVFVFILLTSCSILFVRDMIFKFFIMYTIPFQITMFVSLIYRATGEFNKYVVIRIIINAFNFLSVVCVILIWQSPYLYMIIQIIGYAIISIVYCWKILLSRGTVAKIEIQEIKNLMSIGFVVMVANTINSLFFTLDRWFIKMNFNIESFAYYSFAISMLNLFMTLINSITILFYPYISKRKEKGKHIYEIKKYVILITAFSPIGYFILEFIVSRFMPQYINSLNILQVLLLSLPFTTVINVVYCNLYKSLGKERQYLVTVIKILILAFVLNLFCLNVYHKEISIAIATLISIVIWYVHSSNHFESLKVELREYVFFLIFILLNMLISSTNIQSFIKCILFGMIIMFSEYVLYRDEIGNVFKAVYSFFNKKYNVTTRKDKII